MMHTPTYTPSADVAAALEAGDVEALLAAQAARFGGYRMEADPAAGETGAEGGENTPPADPPAGNTDEGDEGEKDPRVTRANREAAKYRTDLRAEQEARAALEQKLAEQGETLTKLAAVFNPEAAGDGKADPAEQLATITSEAEALRTKVQHLEGALLVHELAGEHGGNPVALLDSRRFTEALQSIDSGAEDYRDQVAEAIRSAVSSNASLAAAGQVPSRGGATGAGQGAASSGAVTQDQFDRMGYAERAELYASNPDLYRQLAGAGS